MMCESIIKTYDMVAPKTDIRTSRSPSPLQASTKPMTPGTTSATPRHVAAGYREPPRKVPCPREREDLARVGVDERVEAGDQTRDTNDVDECKQGVLTAVGVGRGDRVGKRCAGLLDLRRAPTT